MTQLPDNEMEKMIREASDRHQPAGAGPDWDSMQALLDKHMPEKKRSRKSLFILLSVLLLLSAGSLIYVRLKPAQTISGIERQADNNTNLQPSLPDLSSTDKTAKRRQHSMNDISNRSNHDNSNKPGSVYPGEHKPRLLKKSGHAKSNIAAAEISEDNSNIANAAIFPVTGEVNDSLITTRAKESPDTNSPVISQKSAGDSMTSGKVATSPIKDSKNKGNTGTKKRKAFEFSLLYAAELTTVKFTRLDKPGSNYGILIGYPVFKNMVLQTGFIQSRKNYTANGDDFELSYVLPPNRTITEVTGYCTMYEVPLAIKSMITTGKKMNVFYTAGISSYFMKEEFYTYHYKTPSGEYSRDESIQEQKNYWFSLAAASIGLEIPLAPHLSLAAAPFLKVPFTGMGKGNLDLWGTGINFTLTYKTAR